MEGDVCDGPSEEKNIVELIMSLLSDRVPGASRKGGNVLTSCDGQLLPIYLGFRQPYKRFIRCLAIM